MLFGHHPHVIAAPQPTKQAIGTLVMNATQRYETLGDVTPKSQLS